MNNIDTSIQLAASLNTSKYTDKNYGTIGDTINYTIVLVNSGTTEAYNVIVTDLIPQGANFVSGTIKVNNIAQAGDPALGINLATIPVAGVTTITMQATVVTVPWTGNLVNYAQTDYQYTDLTTTPNVVNISVDSNSVITTINSPVINVSKSTPDTLITGAGQVLTYIIKISNGGSVTANNLTFIDTVPVGTSFVGGSVNILGTPYPALTVEPPTGLSIGDLPAGYYLTLSFEVTVTSVPANNSISNFGDASYTYLLDPVTPITASGISGSNTVTLFTSNLRADLSGITKWTNKRYATLGDQITYVITVPNSGNTTAINVTLVDTIPNGTTYVTNSLLVNGAPSANLPSSINVGTIGIGALATVQFNVRVN